jgi:hypothetical protein
MSKNNLINSLGFLYHHFMSLLYTINRYEVRRIALSTHKKVYEKSHHFNTFKSRSTGEFPSSVPEGSRAPHALAGLETN